MKARIIALTLAALTIGAGAAQAREPTHVYRNVATYRPAGVALFRTDLQLRYRDNGNRPVWRVSGSVTGIGSRVHWRITARRLTTDRCVTSTAGATTSCRVAVAVTWADDHGTKVYYRLGSKVTYQASRMVTISR